MLKVCRKLLLKSYCDHFQISTSIMTSSFADPVSYLDMIQVFLTVKILSKFLSLIFKFVIRFISVSKF